ncbi:MAG: helix-turn-helix domain-containing protein [Bauldia sp.]
MSSLAIGAVADRSGVKVPTIRYYESIGLLPVPPRSEGNRRTYGDDTVRRLRFIRHARELGFEVEAIRELLRLSEDPEQSCHGVDSIAAAHLADINGKIARLVALRDEIARMVDECASGSIETCRVIEVLADDSHDHEPFPLRVGT